MKVLNRIITVFIYLSFFNILTAGEITLPVDSSYMPLAVGNKWVYLRKYIVYSPSSSEVHSKVVTNVSKDTIINGKHYFYVNRPGADYWWMRYDQDSNRLIQYTPIPPCMNNNYESLSFSFRLGKDSTYGECNFSLACLFVSDSASYFGVSTKVRRFEKSSYVWHEFTNFEYNFMKYFGMLLYKFNYASFSTTYADIYELTGCIIDGVLYGDTSTVISSINHAEILDRYELYQNYPNPFNPSTTIKFSIPKSSFVTLKVYDINGRNVANLLNENMNPGVYYSPFSGADLSSGVYYYTLETKDLTTGKVFKGAKKMLIVK